MEPPLISGFCSVKRLRAFYSSPLDWTLIHHKLAPSRFWHIYLFTYPGRMEKWVSLGEKEGRTNIQISAEPGIELGSLWSEGRDLTNCANNARALSYIQIFRFHQFWYHRSFCFPNFVINDAFFRIVFVLYFLKFIKFQPAEAGQPGLHTRQGRLTRVRQRVHVNSYKRLIGEGWFPGLRPMTRFGIHPRIYPNGPLI